MDTRRGSIVLFSSDLEEALNAGEDVESDSRTPLDKTIDKIGMGPYQWALLGLCGFGWMADNMWLQGVAIALPRVQDHYGVSDQHIGWLSASVFCGMMIGAVGWGSCADIMGRSTVFNATLLLTSIFGVLTTLSTSFIGICISLFFLGTSVGGSMPTDGTLFLENIPRSKQYLLTVLSVFFSVGAVLSAVVALFVIPPYSCPEVIAANESFADISTPPCDPNTQNQGWKYMFGILTLITIFMFVARIFLFRLHESPRYLVSAGRPEEAIHALREITHFNGNTLRLSLKDVEDVLATPQSRDETTEPEPTSRTSLTFPGRTSSPSSGSGSGYNSTDSTSEPLNANKSYPFKSPTEEHAELLSSHELDDEPKPPMMRRRSNSTATVLGVMPRFIARPLRSWLERVNVLFTPQWKRTTILMWAVWGLTSLAYTMYNVFLPKLLEGRAGEKHGNTPGSRQAAMWDIVMFSLGGCPGPILGAWMIESRLGRKKSLALSIFATAACCILFVQVSGQTVVIAMSLWATTMWAVLYGMTPEIFETSVRGTACGNASALSRIGGIIAPLLGGTLLVIDRSLPLYVSCVILIVAAFCAIALPYQSAAEVYDAASSLAMHH